MYSTDSKTGPARLVNAATRLLTALPLLGVVTFCCMRRRMQIDEARAGRDPSSPPTTQHGANNGAPVRDVQMI